jgi:hypothetical protein
MLSWNKKTLDICGGIGSIATGFACIWFALQHSPQESIYKVWVGMCILLFLNGILMLVHASLKNGLPGLAQTLRYQPPMNRPVTRPRH